MVFNIIVFCVFPDLFSFSLWITSFYPKSSTNWVCGYSFVNVLYTIDFYDDCILYWHWSLPISFIFLLFYNNLQQQIKYQWSLRKCICQCVISFWYEAYMYFYFVDIGFFARLFSYLIRMIIFRFKNIKNSICRNWLVNLL